MKTVEYLPDGAGRCARAHVKATLISPSGNRYTSSNFCMSPVTTCPRSHLPGGIGYEMCKDICKQPAHAEVQAINIAGKDAKGSTIFVEHDWCCDGCRKAAEAAGVSKIVLGKPE